MAKQISSTKVFNKYPMILRSNFWLEVKWRFSQMMSLGSSIEKMGLRNVKVPGADSTTRESFPNFNRVSVPKNRIQLEDKYLSRINS